MGLRKEYRSSAWIRIGLLVLLLVVVVWATSCGLGTAAEEKKQNWRPTEEIATMERLLQVALAPVGNTMYIWGGGWESEDTKTESTATQIGMPKAWAEFAKVQTGDYNFKEFLEQEGSQTMGLDCSGYVGWVMYNLFHQKDGEEGYVCKSTELSAKLAERGWGKLIQNPKDFLAGDIVSMEGHVWICLGTCQDNSVLLVHSSPPGVSVCGTISPEGEGNTSLAIRLATEYMSSHHPQWQEKYPNRTVPATYLENVTLLRWNSETLRNAKAYQEKAGEEIMELLDSF